ncbi:MAG TPA: NAD(P)H-dependent glycerol-3-phosphate dehydrogenase [Burkholderiales bacterium]
MGELSAAGVAVLGAGAWGTALACALAHRMPVVLWARDAALAARMARMRANPRYLPGIELPASLRITPDLDAAIAGAGLLVVATPVAGLRALLPSLPAHGALLWLCKGFEQGSGRLPHQVVDEVLGPSMRCGALTGPTFALEVARGLPCAMTLAARDSAFAQESAALLHGPRMRVYFSDDLIGAEVGGAVKNVMAIAVGLCDGLGFGQNARAALVTRGLAEIMRLGIAMGGVAETFLGLSGAGDLILTSTGDLSRNRRVGLELARGRPLDSILAELGHVAEGVRSAAETLRLATRHGVDMPVTAAVVDVLEGRQAPQAAAEALLARDARREA